MAVSGYTAAWCPQERRYAGLKPGELPICESLKDTIARALPFWNEEIAPQIKAGKRVLIAAHGNSLRGIVKHLEGEASLTCCMGGGGRDTGPCMSGFRFSSAHCLAQAALQLFSAQGGAFKLN